MKPSSGTLALVRIFVWVIAITVALGYFAHVRAQSGGLPEQGMVIPLRPLAPLSTVPVPPVFGMEGILADKTAAIELGKALFWDMQAGSDDIQACASCHFNAGADSRAINQVNPGQAGGDNSFQLGVSEMDRWDRTITTKQARRTPVLAATTTAIFHSAKWRT